MWQAQPLQTDHRAAPLAVGVALGDLRPQEQKSRSLFDDGGSHTLETHDKLNAVIDAVNLRYGKNKLYFGGAHQAMYAAPMRIAFQHLPDMEIERND